MLTKLGVVRYDPPVAASPGRPESVACPGTGGSGYGGSTPGNSGAGPGDGSGVVVIGGCYLVTIPCGRLQSGRCGVLVCP